MTSAPTETRTTAAGELADRYVALWNERDAAVRRRAIAELYTPDAQHLVQPPEEIRRVAAQPGIGLTAILEARGHGEIEARVASAHEHWVGSEGLTFLRRDAAEQLDDVVTFRWEALDGSGERVAGGRQVFVLAADGRIGRDLTFVDA